MPNVIQSIEELDLAGRRTFIRVDFNVPLDAEGRVEDDSRILAALPTINYAREAGARIILASHLGRPKGKRKPRLSLMAVGQHLAELLGTEIRLPHDCIGDGPRKLVQDLRDGQIVLLENLRFNPGETANDENFARQLATLCDHYVNDAFGAAHRAHASVSALPKLIPSRAAGLLLQKEMRNLTALLANPEAPFVAVLGGAKVSSKIGAFDALLSKVQTVIIGGAMAYTFLAAKGIRLGASRVEENKIAYARRTLLKAEDRGVQLLLPEDHVCVKEISPDATSTIATHTDFPADGIAVDIGPKTIARFQEAMDSARTVFWNGPMGIFEMPAFAKGTQAIASTIAHVSGKTVVGGGDSVSALKQSGFLPFISHVSTGGGASLEFIEGKTLPGIEALETPEPTR